MPKRQSIPNSELMPAANQLKEHLRKVPQVPLERNFIRWYLKTSLETGLSNVDIVDGAGDGGIDAYYISPTEVRIYQMKYEKVLRLSRASNEDITEFSKIASLFTDKREEPFSEWLKDVRPDLRHRYVRLRKMIQVEDRLARYIFVTTKHAKNKYTNIEVEDATQVFSLWNIQHATDETPLEELTIRLRKSWKLNKGGGFTTYIGLADTRDFMDCIDKEGEKLFARNVRTDLDSDINEKIRQTFEDVREVDNFWLGNNGIYIVCQGIRKTGSLITMKYPSVINGSQTLHAIHKSSRSGRPTAIMVRILKANFSDDKEFLRKIIIRTNAQNAMNVMNLAAFDHHQINIYEHLKNYNIFYERRQSEWKNEKKYRNTEYHPISIKDLAQWLSTLTPSIGFGYARSNVSKLFDEKNYKKIYAGFGNGLNEAELSRLVCMVWSGLLIKNYISNLRSTKKAHARMSSLIFIRGIYQAVHSSKALRTLVNTKLRKYEVGGHDFPSELKKALNKILGLLENKQKSFQASNENVDYSNYFKRDDLTKKAYRAGFTESRIAKIANMLLKHEGGIL